MATFSPLIRSGLVLAILVGTALPASAAPVADNRFGIAEGFRNPSVMADIGAGWERLILRPPLRLNDSD